MCRGAAVLMDGTLSGSRLPRESHPRRHGTAVVANDGRVRRRLVLGADGDQVVSQSIPLAQQRIDAVARASVRHAGCETAVSADNTVELSCNFGHGALDESAAHAARTQAGGEIIESSVTVECKENCAVQHIPTVRGRSVEFGRIGLPNVLYRTTPAARRPYTRGVTTDTNAGAP